MSSAGMYGIVRRMYGIERHAEEKSDLGPDPRISSAVCGVRPC